jgi:RND superfamily putative drug exporter
MSTAEAIRIGTATTGRLITAAALVLAVVAGSFVFSDLVMMKYLAFGLMAALLLDATVVRMFLVPAVMKLLGDDCWWAPMWMKRLQNRLGLGEIHLPDERKLPSPRPRSSRSATATRPPVTPRPPHDPTHPSADGAPRPSRPVAPPPRPDVRPPTPAAPSAAGTTRMPAPGGPEPKEAPTTRFSAQPKTPTGRPPAPPQGPPPPARGEDREIESWLSDLRGGKTGDPRGAGPTPPPQPSADETRALQVPREQPSGPPPAEAADATTAIPTPPRENNDPEVATEKMNARGDNPDRPRPRRGGGLSAADLLRREGRM